MKTMNIETLAVELAAYAAHVLYGYSDDDNGYRVIAYVAKRDPRGNEAMGILEAAIPRFKTLRVDALQVALQDYVKNSPITLDCEESSPFEPCEP